MAAVRGWCSGLKVVATAPRAEGVAWLQALGADAVVNHHQPLGPPLEAIGIRGIALVAGLTHTDVHFETLVDLLRAQGAFALIDDPDPATWWRQGEILTMVADLGIQGILRSTARTFLIPIAAATLGRAHAEPEAHCRIGRLVLSGFS